MRSVSNKKPSPGSAQDEDHPSGRNRGTVKQNGAEDGTRTRDPDLGKVVLYQLSYFRSNRINNTRTDAFAQEGDTRPRERD